MSDLAHLRPDNDENNCTTYGDPENQTGRAHSWMWESGESNWRVCTTCGRRDWNNRARLPTPAEKPVA